MTSVAAPPTPETLIRQYRWISVGSTVSASLIWGVNTLFLLDAGLSIYETFLVNGLYSVAMTLFEVPTGVFADTLGRRGSVLAGLLVLSVGTFAYVALAAYGAPLWLWAAVTAVLGIGFTFQSGALEAWIVDALDAAGFKGSLDDVFSKTQRFSNLGMFFGTLSGGALGSLDLSLAYWVRGAIQLIVFASILRCVRDWGFNPKTFRWSQYPSQMRKIAAESLEFGWGRPEARWIIAASAFHGLFMMWGFYAGQKHFLDLLGKNWPWVSGLIASIVSLALAGGNWGAEKLRPLFRTRTGLMSWASVGFTVGAVLTGCFDNFFAAVGCFVFHGAAFGAYSPVKQAFLNSVTPSSHRATVLSFDSLVSSGAGGVGQAWLGRVGESGGLAFGYRIGGAVTALALGALFKLRRLNAKADRL